MKVITLFTLFLSIPSLFFAQITTKGVESITHLRI